MRPHPARQEHIVLRMTMNLLMGMLLLPLAAACQADPEPLDPVAEAVTEAAPVAQDTTTDSASHAAHGAGQEAQALRPIMLGMSADLAGLLGALWTDDHDGLSDRARRLADHAPISAEEAARIQAVLGAEMEAFEAADEVVHEAAVRMSRAADARDTGRLLEELAAVQRGCVACHTRFRDRLRTTGR